MEVNPKTAKYKYFYRGRIYYFCSKHCYNMFIRNPDYYLEHGPVGMEH